jgi:hypothetical protein
MLHLITRHYFYILFLVLSLLAYLPVHAEETLSAETTYVVEQDIANENIADESLENEDGSLIDDEHYPFETDDEVAIEDEMDEKESFFSFLDSPQAYLASTVEGMARRIDKFFIEDEVFYESSGSYLRLIYSRIFEEGGKQSSLNRVRFKLRLPETQKRLKVFLESSPRDEPYNVTTQTENFPESVTEEDDYIVGIQSESGEGFGWKYKPRIGAHLGSSVEPFVQFKFSREDKLGQWTLSWDEIPYWDDSVGWGFDSSLVFNRKIDERNLFRSSTFAGWKNATEMFDLSQVFALFHTFSSRRAISFYTGAYGVSEPTTQVTQYLVGSIYRQNIHKDYLFIEIEPQIRYQRMMKLSQTKKCGNMLIIRGTKIPSMRYNEEIPVPVSMVEIGPDHTRKVTYDH